MRNISRSTASNVLSSALFAAKLMAVFFPTYAGSLLLTECLLPNIQSANRNMARLAVPNIIGDLTEVTAPPVPLEAEQQASENQGTLLLQDAELRLPRSYHYYYFGSSSPIILTVRDMALDHLLIMFIGDNKSSQSSGPRLIFHGKPQASDFEDGRQEGSPARLSGQLYIEVGPDSGKLIFKARLRCDGGQLGSMHLHVAKPPEEAPRVNFNSWANLMSSVDCVEGKAIQREIRVTFGGGAY